MIRDNVPQAIFKVLDHFHSNAEIEEIEDWQGTTDYSGHKMYVLRNLSFLISTGTIFDTSVNHLEILQKSTGCDMPWAEDHFQERVSGLPTNPGETYKYWPYHTNLDNDEKYKQEVFSHTYQERFWPKLAANTHMNPLTYMDDVDGMPYRFKPRIGLRFQLGDLNDVINLLSRNPKTRQAYLPIWFPEDTWAANNSKRVPCTLGYYFWIQDDKLHCNYIIRSCDIFRHFRNDVYFTIRLMQHVVKEINYYIADFAVPMIDTGNLTMYIFNLHMFKNDEYAFNKKETKLNNNG